MIVFKYIIRFFLSLNTTLWLLGFLLIVFFAGAFIMPGSQEFQHLHSVPLFEWLNEQPLKIIWWLWGVIGILSLLALNTLFCSIESIIKKKKVTQWLLLISPQVIHIGFFFMLLAHLYSALGASQQLVVAREGSLLKLSDNDTSLEVRDININMDSRGYITEWEIDIEYLSDETKFHRDTIRPNKPSLYAGLNVNVKDLRAFPQKAVLLRISREPGAIWALIGSILFITGIAILIILKIRVESRVSL